MIELTGALILTAWVLSLALVRRFIPLESLLAPASVGALLALLLAADQL